jgi:hypothetical protein
VGLRTAVDALKQEKTQIVEDHETDIAVEQKFFETTASVTVGGFASSV